MLMFRSKACVVVMVLVMIGILAICGLYAVIYADQSKHRLMKTAEHKVFMEVSGACEAKEPAPAAFDKSMYGSFAFIGLLLLIFVVLLTIGLISGNFANGFVDGFPIAATVTFVIGLILSAIVIGVNSDNGRVNVCPATAEKYSKPMYTAAYNAQYAIVGLCAIGVIACLVWSYINIVPQ